MAAPDFNRIYGFFVDGRKNVSNIEKYVENFDPEENYDLSWDDFCELVTFKEVNGVQIKMEFSGCVINRKD